MKNDLDTFKTIVDTPGLNIEEPRGPAKTTLLMYAVQGKRLPFVKYLIEKGANPNLKTQSGEYLLPWAIEWQPEEIVDALLDSPKVDMNVKNT